MTTHRGAYLHALGVIPEAGLTARSSYLWTLPMFHCNGWAYTWAVTAAGAKHVCLPKVEAEPIWRALTSEGVTHLCAAPTVLTTIVVRRAGELARGARRGVRRRRAAGARAAREGRRASTCTSRTSTG